MTKRVDLVVVGAGILGTFHAYFALQRGLRVALVERHGEPRGATVRNFGQIVPSGMNAKWREIGRESLAHYKLLQQETDITLRTEGSLYVANTREEVGLLEELKALVNAEDYPAGLLTTRECRSHCSSLRADYVRAGLYFPEEVSLDPRLAVHRIRTHLVAHYGLLYFGSRRARSVEPEADGVVITLGSGELLWADQVFVCGGDEVSELFPEVYAGAGLVISQLQMLRLEVQTGVRIPGNLLTGRSIRRYEAFRECPSYATALAVAADDEFAERYGIHVLFKQADDGSIIIGDSHLYAPATDDRCLPFDSLEEVDQYILRAARRICDLPSWRPTHRWQGRYLQCEGRDVFAQTLHGRVHLVTGIGGKGMTAGPGYARRSVDRIYASISNYTL